MASKLYPPILEASIPAFYGYAVTIPFKHNPLVSSKEYSNLVVQVKQINGEIIDGSPFDAVILAGTIEQLFLSLPSNLNTFKKGNWYKFSIAYKSNSGLIGYYSTAAVAKYLGESSPYVKIIHENGVYKGIYMHEDISEKAYSYQFILTDKQGNIIEDTGEKIHNINVDQEANTSEDIYQFRYNLDQNKNIFYLEYILTTITGLVFSTKTQIEKGILDGANQDTLFDLTAKINREEGSVEIWGTGKCSPITGNFILRKACSKDNFMRIQTITSFSLTRQNMIDDNGNIFQLKLCEDLTCEAGYYYKYFIQRYNKYQIFSNVIGESQTVFVSFDHCFLYDGEKQLKIMFNPKISSFKTNILQSKTDTIGSKYPFITRNGIVNYKEFPISGLISFQMDEQQYFMSLEDQIRLGIIPDHVEREETESAGQKRNLTYPEKRYLRKTLERGNVINLVDINISAEKEFKLMVLDFLNSKKPKLFRSATEGNYYVYTMNSSLTPNDTLGRMLHTFNCTAYEIASVQDFYDSLIDQNIENLFNENNMLTERQLKGYYSRTKSVKATDKDALFNLLQDGEYARNFYIRDADPLSCFTVSFVNRKDFKAKCEDQIITIGATGSYNYFCSNNDLYITGVRAGAILPSGERVGVSSYFTINFKNFIKLSLTNFDFLSDYLEEDVLAMQLMKGTGLNDANKKKAEKISDRQKILKYYNYVINTIDNALNSIESYIVHNHDLESQYQEIIGTLLIDPANESVNQEFRLFRDNIDETNSKYADFSALLQLILALFKQIWAKNTNGYNIVEALQNNSESNIVLLQRLLTYKLPRDFGDIVSELNLIQLVDDIKQPSLELQSPTDCNILIQNNYNSSIDTRVAVQLDCIHLLRARNFNEHYAQPAVFGIFNYHSIIEEIKNINKILIAREEYNNDIFVSENLFKFLTQEGFLKSNSLWARYLKQLSLEESIYYNERGGLDENYFSNFYVSYLITVYGNSLGQSTDSTSPLGKAISKQEQSVRTIIIPPSSTVVLAINESSPENFYFYGSTGDDICYDITYSTSIQQYKFNI